MLKDFTDTLWHNPNPTHNNCKELKHTHSSVTACFLKHKRMERQILFFASLMRCGSPSEQPCSWPSARPAALERCHCRSKHQWTCQRQQPEQSKLKIARGENEVCHYAWGAATGEHGTARKEWLTLGQQEIRHDPEHSSCEQQGGKWLATFPPSQTGNGLVTLKRVSCNYVHTLFFHHAGDEMRAGAQKNTEDISWTGVVGVIMCCLCLSTARVLHI